MRKANPFDYFFLLRPLILIPSWNFLLIGAYLAQDGERPVGRLLLAACIYTLIMGGIYILNQITDRETDRINKKLFLLSEGYIPVRHAYVEMMFLWAAGLALSSFFSITFFVFILISLILGTMYSLPPVKLKGKPLLDTLSNGIGYGMVNFIVGWLVLRPPTWAMTMEFLPYFLSICAVFMNTTIADREGDEKAGEITTAVFLGARITAFVSTVLMAGAVMIALHNRDPVCLVPAALSFPLFMYLGIYSLVKQGPAPRKLLIMSFRLPGVLFTIITAILYPVYGAVLALVFIAMRVYYHRRFGIIYPTLAQG
ncbi:MAG: UbiA prenyltransferase family protein [candidate division WOR-3 bacterium]|nr:MAG: UbiA prenyltransferase family protein [candidate division WOR-3 bacterium]